MKAKLFILVFAVLSTSSYALSLKCLDSDDGLEIFVHQYSAEDGWDYRPSLMEIRDPYLGTLLRQRGKGIRKYIQGKTVRFNSPGNNDIAADEVTLAVRFKRGQEVLRAGEFVRGQLIFIQDDDWEVLQVQCSKF